MISRTLQRDEKPDVEISRWRAHPKEDFAFGRARRAQPVLDLVDRVKSPPA